MPDHDTTVLPLCTLDNSNTLWSEISNLGKDYSTHIDILKLATLLELDCCNLLQNLQHLPNFEPESKLCPDRKCK